MVLAGLSGWAYGAKVLADQTRAAANPNHVRLYLLTVLVEWIFFALVLAGVRWSGASVLLFLESAGIPSVKCCAISGLSRVWIVAAMLLLLFGWLLRTAAEARNVQFILPHGRIEMALWIALSVTAGICEEAIFRGYLQRQFMALTQNPAAGIILSALAFGAAHAYQGFRMVILIAIYGSMFGVLAYWRGTTRPGMIVRLAGFVGRNSWRLNEALDSRCARSRTQTSSRFMAGQFV